MVADHSQCDNCKRKQFDAPDKRYLLHFQSVRSSEVKQVGNVLRLVRKTKSARTATEYILCDECYNFVVHDNKSFEFTWPSFLRHLLVGEQNSSRFKSKRYHVDIYPAKVLWRMIPETMRPWWINYVHEFDIFGYRPYAGCSIADPPALFRDATTSLGQYQNDVDSGEPARLLRAMKNSDVMLPNVLCPFGCSEFCTMSAHLDWRLVLQRLLLKIYLPLPLLSEDRKYQNVHNMTNQYFREPGDYDLILLNKAWSVMPTIIFSDKGPMVQTCRHHGDGSKRLYLYPPRSPGHTLGAENPDQLSPLRIVQREHTPVKRHQYCTQFGMCRQVGNYTGISTFGISTDSSWSKPSILRSQQEALTIAGRSDINALLTRKVEKNQANPMLAESLRELSRELYPEGSLTPYIQGSTYVRFKANIIIQLSISKGDDEVSYMNENRTVFQCRRSWPRVINILQTEDMFKFGTQFNPIPICRTISTDTSAMMLLMLPC